MSYSNSCPAAPPILLASASPRRRELLGRLIDGFKILVPDVDETLLEGERLEQATQRLAAAKAIAVGTKSPGALIIAADTLVGLRETDHDLILAKPKTTVDAERMLATLSGRSHLVVTGVALIVPTTGSRAKTFFERTEVAFRELNSEEIANYVATGEPMDKAGAYAIQGGAAGFVNSISGSLSNVIGLPLERLAIELRSLGIDLKPNEV